MQLTIAWWNTALSPPSHQNRASPDERFIAGEVVRALTETFGFDVVILGEVSGEDVDFFKELEIASEYRFVRAMNPAGRGFFDVCLLHRKDVLQVNDPVDIVLEVDGRNTRIGQRFDAFVTGEPKPVHLFASHWPSLATIGKYDPDRWRLGDRLRTPVAELLKRDKDSHIVLVGDYNDEPFDYSIAHNLLASRDSAVVADRPGLLYNPFWRHLSPFDHGLAEPLTDKGTYYHQNGTVTKWHTFDQMMFSSAYVTGSAGWRLDEHRTRVLELPGYTEMVANRTHVFDHLPIFGRVSKEGTL